MEIQSIDLYGDFLLNGSTGSSGQVLTFDESGGFTWGTASTGGSGPTSSYLKLEGYNYVICETVNTGVPASDALDNGNILWNAYNQAKNLNVGALSATNRVSVLLMPGDYDLGDAGQFQLDTSYVDIIGISTNPYDTILRSSSQYATLQYTSPIDSSLRNVYLKPGTSLAVDDNGGAADGSYLRWDNVVLEGNSFNDGNYLSGFQNIYGEFRNITISDNTFAFVTATGSINGVFENIQIGSGGLAISITPQPENPNLTLSGTFSDIVIGSGGIALTSWGNISGSFRNIVSESPCLNANFNTEGNFENIESNSGIFSGSNLIGTGYIKGTFKNLKVVGTGFLAYEYIDGIFENLEISGGGSDVFSANGTISGTFSNITIGNVDYAFREADTLCGHFENIKIGNVLSSAFKTSVDVLGTNPGKLYGTFKNIDIVSVDDSAFHSQDLISGDFENIKIGSLTDTTNNFCFHTEWSNSIIDGNFKNIEIGNSDGTSQAYIFTSGATLSGTYSDINIGQSNYWNTSTTLVFFAGLQGVGTSSLMGSFENLDIKSNGMIFYSQTGNLDCTINNLKTSNSSNLICSNYENILGTYSNIKCFGTSSYLFESQNGFVNVNLKNLHSDYITNDFVTGNTIHGEYREIFIGYCDNAFSTDVGDLDVIVDNLEVKSFANYLFKGTTKINGTFSNFRIGDGGNMFANASLTYSGYYKNLLIGSISSGIFPGPFDGVIDNLNTISSFGYGNLIDGKIINSRIINLDPNAFGGNGRIYAGLNGVFENNTILNDPAQSFTIEYLGSPGYPVVPDVQAAYNIVNCLIGGVDVNVIGGNNAESLGFTTPIGV